MRRTVADTSPLPARRLSELPLWAEGTVHAVAGAEDVRRRLLEMGFCNRVTVTVVRRAPLGDPVEFRLRGYNVSLRKEEAACIFVVPAVPAFEDVPPIGTKES